MFRFTVRDVLWASTLAVLALCCLATIAGLGMSPHFRVGDALQRATEARFKYEAEAERVALLEQENAELRRRLSVTALSATPVLAPAADPPVDHEVAFQRWLESPPEKFQKAYQRRLEELGLNSKDAIRLFASKVGDGDVRVRKSAVLGLSLIGDKDIASALAALLQAAKDSSKEVRSEAANALGRTGAPPDQAVPALVEVLERDQSYSAARALASLGPKAASALASLTKALTYEDDFTRSTAAEALGNIGPAARAATPELRTALRDESLRLRLAAARAIWQIEKSAPPDVIEVLIEGLSSDEIPAKLMSIRTLADMGPPAKAALPALEAVRNSDDHWSGSASILATGKIQGDKDLVVRLIHELSSPEPGARTGAACALGLMGPEARESLPALRKLLDPPDQGMGYGLFFVDDAIREIEGSKAE